MPILNIQVSSNLICVIKSYEPEKICLILENRETPPKSHRILTKITPSHSAYQRTLLQTFQIPVYKNIEFRIFCQKTENGCVFVFPRGHRIDQVVLECRKRAHSNGNEKF